VSTQPVESNAAAPVSPIRSGCSRRAFTLVEILFSIGVVFLLMALLFVGFHFAQGFARKVTDTQTVSSLKTGVSLFQGDFGFLPPLVKDDIRGDGPLTPLNPNTGRRSVDVYSVSDPDDLLALQGRPTKRGLRRYSEYSLAFYLMGALDQNVDGVDGPGSFEPMRDGSFRTGGRRINPMVDLDQGKGGLNWIDRTTGRVVLRDRVGANIRYYRWEPEARIINTSDLNVPGLVGDVTDDIEVRGAKYAIVLAGANGLFGDEPIDIIQEKLGLAIDPKGSAAAVAQARADNVVGVGQ
jgi:hypothetical protein